MAFFRPIADRCRTICATWNLTGTPTLFIINVKEVIQHKWSGSPGDKNFDATLDHRVRL